MESYKLIKEYPGSPKVGTIVNGYGKQGWYSKGFGHATYDWTLIVLQPKYWEEVVEKDYEIVARKIRSGAIIEYEKGIAVVVNTELARSLICSFVRNSVAELIFNITLIFYYASMYNHFH